MKTYPAEYDLNGKIMFHIIHIRETARGPEMRKWKEMCFCCLDHRWPVLLGRSNGGSSPGEKAPGCSRLLCLELWKIKAGSYMGWTCQDQLARVEAEFVFGKWDYSRLSQVIYQNPESPINGPALRRGRCFTPGGIMCNHKIKDQKGDGKLRSLP